VHRAEVHGSELDAKHLAVALDELEADCTMLVESLEPRGPQALANLGWAALDRGDSERAKRLLLHADGLARSATKIDEELVREIANRLATLYDMAGDATQASEWAAKGTQGRP
jgi:hypothetical protein